MDFRDTTTLLLKGLLIEKQREQGAELRKWVGILFGCLVLGLKSFHSSFRVCRTEQLECEDLQRRPGR